MKNWLFIVLLILINFSAATQSNFIKGIIISNNGDSLYGTIDYRNWKYNPSSINFISENNDKKILDASAIKGFFIPSANETYESFLVDMNMLPGDPDDAINNRFSDSPVVKKKIFLLQLVKHPAASLFLFADSRKEHLYYVKGNTEPVELIHHYIYDESTKQVREVATYKEQLVDFFGACSDVANSAQTVKFAKKSIIDLLLKYIQYAVPGTAVVIKKKDPVLLKFGIIAGAIFNKYQFEGTNTLLVDENYSNNLSPVLGLSIDIGLSRNQHKWHIINELVYKMYKTGSSFTRPYGSGYTRTNDVTLSLSYVQLNSIIRYVFQSKGSLSPYINAGIGNGVIVAENTNSLHTAYSFGTEENAKALDGPKKYEFSLLGGLGLAFNKIQLELRYAASSKSFSPYRDLNINPSSFQFLVTYQF